MKNLFKELVGSTKIPYTNKLKNVVLLIEREVNLNEQTILRTKNILKNFDGELLFHYCCERFNEIFFRLDEKIYFVELSFDYEDEIKTRRLYFNSTLESLTKTFNRDPDKNHYCHYLDKDEFDVEYERKDSNCYYISKEFEEFLEK